MLDIKRMRFPLDVILVCIRWYAAYPLSYRHLEEMMQERGVIVDHSSINRWAIRFLPLHEKLFRRQYKRPGFCRIKFREVEIGYADRISKEAVMHHARY